MWPGRGRHIQAFKTLLKRSRSRRAIEAGRLSPFTHVLTSRQTGPVYCNRVLLFRTIRFVASGCAVAALVALSMLPAEHIHESHERPQVVHRHVVDEPSEHADSGHHGFIEHDGHLGVTILEPTFFSERQYDIERPLVTIAPVLVAPERRVAVGVDLIDDPVAHGPPLRVGSLRAPPA